MTLVLCRVDDRLIHGQVVVGWGQPLGIQRIVLADDEVAKSDWEQDLYRMAVPSGLEVVFATVAAAGAQLRGWERDSKRTAVLLGSIEAAAQLYRAAPRWCGRSTSAAFTTGRAGWSDCRTCT